MVFLCEGRKAAVVLLAGEDVILGRNTARTRRCDIFIRRGIRDWALEGLADNSPA